MRLAWATPTQPVDAIYPSKEGGRSVGLTLAHGSVASDVGVQTGPEIIVPGSRTFRVSPQALLFLESSLFMLCDGRGQSGLSSIAAFSFFFFPIYQTLTVAYASLVLFCPAFKLGLLITQNEALTLLRFGKWTGLSWRL